MPNYLQFVSRKIDAELTQLHARIKELEGARAALSVLGYSDEPNSPPLRKTLKLPKKFVTGQMPKVRSLIAEYLANNPGPQRSKGIIEYVMPQVSCSESTVWKALKDMRDEELLHWDAETRLYTLFVLSQGEAAS